MHEHHSLAIEKIKAHFLEDESVLALILIGSIARSEAWEGSDIDLIAVASDDEYKRRIDNGETTFEGDAFCDYPDGHAGASFVDYQYLTDAAEFGNEPTRFSFMNAKVIFSKRADIEEIIERIAVYPEDEREEKMECFYSQLPVHISYIELGEYSRNSYLLAQCAERLVLFGGRLILAHNRIIYPGRKWFMEKLEQAPDKPEGLTDLVNELLERPSIKAAYAFFESIKNFTDWPQPREGFWDRYRRDCEQHWRSGKAPIDDW